MPGMSIVENCDAASVQTLIQFLQYVLQNKEKLVSHSAPSIFEIMDHTLILLTGSNFIKA